MTTHAETATHYLLRLFEVKADRASEPPVPLPDRQIEAGSIDDARTKATEMLAGERRAVRSLACRAEGGLLAYVYPPEPEPVAPAPRARRPRGKR